LSDDIYREIILDHYRNPRNKGKLTDADVSIHDSNPLCGDEIDIHLKVDVDKIKDIRFEGRGCAISQASASMLTEMVQGKPLTSVKDLTKDDILENIGLVNLGPARIKCALLSLKVLKLGMVKYYADRDPAGHLNQNDRYSAMNLDVLDFEDVLLEMEKSGLLRPIAQNFNTRYYRLWNTLEPVTCRACNVTSYFAQAEENKACLQCSAKV
jgi:nitrogen fixation NifU-like protein